MTSASLRNAFTKLGLNYLWGLANFTAGVTLGGIVVAAILIRQLT